MNKVSNLVIFIEALNKSLYQSISMIEGEIAQKRLKIDKNFVVIWGHFFTRTKGKFVVTKYAEVPPKFAQYLLYLFVNKENRDALLGDLEEDYWDVYNKFGPKKARFFYQWQVCKSIWPLISASVGKLLKLFIEGIVARFSVSK